jgi:hypothetical protein
VGVTGGRRIEPRPIPGESEVRVLPRLVRAASTHEGPSSVRALGCPVRVVREAGVTDTIWTPDSSRAGTSAAGRKRSDLARIGSGR